MHAASAYYSPPTITVTPAMHKSSTAHKGVMRRVSNPTANAPFLPMSIPLPGSSRNGSGSSLSQSSSRHDAAKPTASSSSKHTHSHQHSHSHQPKSTGTSTGTSISNSNSNSSYQQSPSHSSGPHQYKTQPSYNMPVPNHRYSKQPTASSAYYSSSLWDAVASTPPRDDLLGSTSFHQSHHRSNYHSNRNSTHGYNHYNYDGQYQQNYMVGSFQSQYTDTAAGGGMYGHISSSYNSNAPLASSMPAYISGSMPSTTIGQRIVQKPRKKVTFADPIATIAEVPSLSSSAPSSLPPLSPLSSFASQIGASLASAYMDYADYNASRTGNPGIYSASNAAMMSHAASSYDQNSPPYPENQGYKHYHGSSNSSGSYYNHGHSHSGHGHSHHRKHRYSYHENTNGNSGSFNDEYDDFEQKRHRYKQLYLEEGSTFRAEKIKMSQAHRDSHNNHHHRSHSSNHSHRRSGSSHDNSNSLAVNNNDTSSSSSCNPYHYDDRFSRSMEHLPLSDPATLC
ncbi:hypothetical protein GGI25_000514 [Coemansia spiralis]|uniref:Uncharacterized protein n=2 Tax=Coemansia TaxID=4863 RepID=A0A9W8L0W4_9FUNG|nr:hypothetical protein EDC05_000342 [Coemansia umbellata]KAJ2625418.1 hypothetical protein GGI26_000558 [Coemansia sp. RSA 1358]KAJ2680541.1 hypothetical protein GGI25_000514 [Coemansia spiralis]